jgi:uncharacterized SAM-binding protein YcdF (DUF218 family)
MLTYFISSSNDYTIRTDANTSTNVILNLQNMITQQNFTASLTGVSVESYESILSFTASISGARVGDEYRATIVLSGSNEPIWNGAIQAFVSQSENKPEYVNQIPLPENGIDPYKSNVTTNSFIILQ